jgi:hypothetical protein
MLGRVYPVLRGRSIVKPVNSGNAVAGAGVLEAGGGVPAAGGSATAGGVPAAAWVPLRELTWAPPH